jgi:CSLREA domain-containing protein
MIKKSLGVGVAVLAAGLIFVTGGGAATTTTVTLTVNTTADGATPCAITNHKSAGTCTLRGAILAANSLQQDNTMFVIKLAAKTYKLSLGTLDVTAATVNSANIVQIVGKTKTTGKGKHKKTLPASIIDGSGNAKPASVIEIDSPTQMSNVVIQGGSGNGAYECDTSSAYYGCGGGVFLTSALDLENSVVQHNTACSAWTGSACTGSYTYGGGIYIANSNYQATLTLYKTTVTHNISFQGGGIDNENGNGSTVLITQSHIDRNTACDAFSSGFCIGTGRGGGLANNGEQVTFDRSTVNGNVAGSPAYKTGDGGGIYQDSDNMQLNHTTVSGNVAGDEGGGIYDDENVDFLSSTVSHNMAGVYGGGMYLDYLASVTNTTFSSNTAGGTFECTIGSKTTCNHTVKTITGTCLSLYPSATACTQQDGYGGGIYSDSEYPEFVSSTVTKNLAVSIAGDAKNCGGGLGGGIYTWWTLTMLSGTKVTDNTADCGGGFYNNYDTPNQNGTFALSNSTISGNGALEDGGGIWTGGSGSGTLYGMTITKNHAGRQTGGVWDNQLGSVLLGSGNTITKNTSKGACKNLMFPCK